MKKLDDNTSSFENRKGDKQLELASLITKSRDKLNDLKES